MYKDLGFVKECNDSYISAFSFFKAWFESATTDIKVLKYNCREISIDFKMSKNIWDVTI